MDIFNLITERLDYYYKKARVVFPRITVKGKNAKKIVKKIFYSIFFSLYWPIVVTAQVNQAVTNRLCPGRFGDKIVYYAIAKWVSYRFNIPLFLKSFEYSAMLRLGKNERKYSNEVLKRFKEGILKIRSEQDVVMNTKDNVIFESDKYFYMNGSHRKEQWIAHMSLDQRFMEKLKYMLQPVVPMSPINLPKDKVTIAVHIRKGGGVDKPLYSIQYYQNKKVSYADKTWALKFPPEQYYVDQIKKIASLFGNKPLFIYIFTDDRNPSKLVSRIKKAVNKSNITFSCRSKGNAHDVHVVEDFYNMACFDCLIRSSSSFAIIAQLLGNHQVIIYPKHFKWVEKKLIIDEITVIDNRTS